MIRYCTGQPFRIRNTPTTSATPTDAAAREKLLKVFEHPHVLLHGDPSQVVLFVAAPTATRVSRAVSGLGGF